MTEVTEGKTEEEETVRMTGGLAGTEITEMREIPVEEREEGEVQETEIDVDIVVCILCYKSSII